MTRYVIEGARVFDGGQLIGVRTVEVDGARIVAVGAPVPAAAERAAAGCRCRRVRAPVHRWSVPA